MGRTSPLILRSGHISNNWKSHWFSDSNYTILLTEDLKIRYYINNVYYYLKLPTTETRINRPQNKIGLIFNNVYLPDYLKSLKIYPFRFKFYRLSDIYLNNITTNKYRRKQNIKAFDILLYNYISINFDSEITLETSTYGLIESMLKNIITTYYIRSFDCNYLNKIVINSYLYTLKFNIIFSKQKNNISYNIGAVLDKIRYKYGVNERYYKALTHYQGLMKEISFNGIYNLMYNVRNTNKYLYSKSYIVKSFFYLDSFGKVYNYKPQFNRNSYPFYDLIFFFKKNLSNILRTYSQYKLNKKMKLFHKKRFSYNERLRTYPLQIKDVIRYQEQISFLKKKLLEVMHLSNNFYIYSKNVNVLIKKNTYTNKFDKKFLLKKKKNKLALPNFSYIVHIFLNKLAYLNKKDFNQIQSTLKKALNNPNTKRIILKTPKKQHTPLNTKSWKIKHHSHRYQTRSKFKHSNKKLLKKTIIYNKKKLLKAMGTLNDKNMNQLYKKHYGLSNKYYNTYLRFIKGQNITNSFYNPVYEIPNQIKNKKSLIPINLKKLSKKKNILRHKHVTNIKQRNQRNFSNRFHKKPLSNHTRSSKPLVFIKNGSLVRVDNKYNRSNWNSKKPNYNYNKRNLNNKKQIDLKGLSKHRDASSLLKKNKQLLFDSTNFLKLNRSKKTLKSVINKRDVNKEYTLNFLRQYHPYPSRLLADYIYKVKGYTFENRKKKKYTTRFIPMRKLRLEMSSYDYYRIRQAFKRHNKLKKSVNQSLLDYLFRYTKKQQRRTKKPKRYVQILPMKSLLNLLRQPFLNFFSYKRRFLEIIHFYWKKFEYRTKLLVNNLGFYKIVNNYHNMYKGSNPVPVFFSTKWLVKQQNGNRIDTSTLTSHNFVKWLSDLNNMIPNYINKLTHLNRYFISKGSLPYKYLIKSPYYYIKLRQQKKIKIDKFDIRYIPSFWYKEQELKRIYKKLLKPYKENIKKAFAHNYKHFTFYKDVINEKLESLQYKKMKAHNKKFLTIGEIIFGSFFSSLNTTKIYRGSNYFSNLYRAKAKKLFNISTLNRVAKKRNARISHNNIKQKKTKHSYTPYTYYTYNNKINSDYVIKQKLIEFLLTNVYKNPKFIYKMLIALDGNYRYYYPKYTLFRDQLAYEQYANKMHSKRYESKKRYLNKIKFKNTNINALDRLYKKKPRRYMQSNYLRLLGDNCKKLLLYIKSNMNSTKPRIINYLKSSRYRDLSPQEKKHKGLLLDKNLFGDSYKAMNRNLNKYYELHTKQKEIKENIRQAEVNIRKKRILRIRKKQHKMPINKYNKRRLYNNRRLYNSKTKNDHFHTKYNLVKLITNTVANYHNNFINTINKLGITNNPLNRFLILSREIPFLARSYKVLRSYDLKLHNKKIARLSKKKYISTKSNNKTSLLLYLINPKNIRPLKKKRLLFKYISLFKKKYNAVVCKYTNNYIVLRINRKPQYIRRIIKEYTDINSFFYYKSPYKIRLKPKITAQQFLSKIRHHTKSFNLHETIPYGSYLKKSLYLNNYLEKARVIYKSSFDTEKTSLLRKNKAILFFLFALKSLVNYNLKHRLYNQSTSKDYNTYYANPCKTNYKTYKNSVLFNSNYNYTIRNKIRSIRIVKHLQNIHNTMINTKLSYNYTFFMYLLKTITTHISSYLKGSFYLNYSKYYNLKKTIPTFKLKDRTTINSISRYKLGAASKMYKYRWKRQLNSNKFLTAKNVKKMSRLPNKIILYLLSLMFNYKKKSNKNKIKPINGKINYYSYSPSSMNIRKNINIFSNVKKRIKVAKVLKRFYKYIRNNITRKSDLRYNTYIQSPNNQFILLLNYLPTVTSIYNNIYNTLISKYDLLLNTSITNNNNQLTYFLEKHGFFYKNTFYFLKILRALINNLYNYLKLNIVGLTYDKIRKTYFNQVYTVKDNTINNIKYIWTKYIYYSSKLPAVSTFSGIYNITTNYDYNQKSLNRNKTQESITIDGLEKDFNKKPLSIQAINNIKYYLNRDFTSYLQLNYVMEYDTNKLIGSKENLLYFYGVSGPSNFYNSAFLLNPKLVTDYFYFGVKHKVQIYQLFSDVSESFKDLSYLQIILDKVYSKLFYRTMHYYLDILLDSFYTKLRGDLKIIEYNILFKKFRYFSKLIGFLSYITDLQSHFNLKGLHIISSGRRSRVLRTHKRLWQRGPMSLNTFSDNIDYYYKPIISKFGIMGLKVYLYKEPRHKNPLYHLIYQSLFLRFRLLKTVLNNKTNTN